MTPAEYLVCSLAWMLGVPWPTEALAFPPRVDVQNALAVNRKYREYLQTLTQWQAVHAQRARQAITETEYLFEIWDELDTALSYIDAVRRQAALWRLRALLGEQRFLHRQMPYPVPLQYVTVIPP